MDASFLALPVLVCCPAPLKRVDPYLIPPQLLWRVSMQVHVACVAEGYGPLVPHLKA